MIKIAQLRSLFITIIALLLFTNTVSATNVVYSWTFPSDQMSWLIESPINNDCNTASSCSTTEGWNSTAPSSIFHLMTTATTSDRITSSGMRSTAFSWTNGTPDKVWLNFSYRAVMSGVGAYVTPSAKIVNPAGTNTIVWTTAQINANTLWTNVNMSIITSNFTSSGNYYVVLNATLFGTTNPATAGISYDNVFVNLDYAAAVVYDPINITGWGNNVTNNNTLTFNVNQSRVVSFNLTTNMTITSNTTTFASGVNPISNKTLGTTSFWANFSFPNYGQKWVNLTVTNNSATSDYRNWSIFVDDITPPNQITSFINTTFPTANSVSLSWTAPSDNTGGSGVNRTYIDKTNDSILFSSAPITINATNVRGATAATNWTSGKYSDAYYYTMRNNAPNVSCMTCHSTSPIPADYNASISPFWMKFNSSHLLVYGHMPDNDTDVGDDYFGIALNPDNIDTTLPQTNDVYYRLWENGTVQAFSGDGSGWIINTTLSNNSAVAGAGAKAPRYELAIPLNQIGNPTNLSAIKFIVEVHCTNGSDYVERNQYFPETAKDEVPTGWFTAIYRNITQWDNLSMSSSPTATSLGLSGLTSNFRYNLSAYAKDNVSLNGTRSTNLIIRTSDRVGYNISGFVNSSNGAVVGAHITIHEYTVETNSTGYFKFESMINGTYIVNASNGHKANNNERTVIILGANNVTTNFTIPVDENSNITQSIKVENVVTVTKTPYPVNYVVDPAETQQPIEVSISVVVSKILASVNYVSNVTQEVVVQTQVTISKVTAPVFYFVNTTQTFIITQAVKITKTVAPVFKYMNITQPLLMVGYVNVVKTRYPLNYNRNISQQIYISDTASATKTVAPQYYNRNIIQSFNIENYIKYTKTIASVHYNRNIFQSFVISQYVNTLKTTASTSTNRNITQQISVKDVVSIEKTRYPLSYYNNITQPIYFRDVVGISKTIAPQYYNINITQTFDILQYINITKTLAPPIYYNRNDTQSISITDIISVTKETAPSSGFRQVAQAVSVKNYVNITKDRFEINYYDNLTQGVKISDTVSVAKIVMPKSYERNISQSVSVGNYINVTKTLRTPINYNINVSQDVIFGNYVDITKTTISQFYNRNITQSFNINNYVRFIKTTAPVVGEYYNRNISQDVIISGVVTVTKTIAPTIIGWENSNTTNNTLTFYVQKDTNVTFNITSDQTLTGCSWSGVDVVINCTGTTSYAYKNFTSSGTKYVNMSVSSMNGNSQVLSWTVTVAGVGGLTLSGYVNNSIQYNLSGVRVDLGSKYTFTDANGYYVLTDIDGGDYTLLVRQIGYRNTSTNLTIVDTTMKNITLSENKMAAVRATPGFDGIGLLAGIIVIFILRRNK